MKKIFFFLLLISSGYSYAQDLRIYQSDSIKKTLEAVKINVSLKIDGVLNENEWNLAKPFDDYKEVSPVQGGKPKHYTNTKILFNDQFLYVGVFAKDSLGKKGLRVTTLKRDFNPSESDNVLLLIDGFNDKRNSMCFSANAFGAQRDYLTFDANNFDYDWDGLWKVKTNRTDSGWYAEFAIPWKTLRYSKSDSTNNQFGFNILRRYLRTNEFITLSEFPLSFGPFRMDFAGFLKNVQPPKPTTNFRIQPYVLTSQANNKNIDDKKTIENNIKLGGDIKWAINSNNILDVTLNTDFAQADVDRQVNNLSRFSVFFPERRQFFLENASLFGAGIAAIGNSNGGKVTIQPFFSRNIGLSEDGNPIPIDAGTRFVHRSVKHNYGAMFIKQGKFDSLPSQNFFVGRYSYNFGEQNRIGGIFTTKNEKGNNNVTAAIDGFLRYKDSHSFNWLLSTTNDSKTKTKGFSAAFEYFYQIDNLLVWWTESAITKDYNPALGFLSRNNVIGSTPGFTYTQRKHLPLKKIIRTYDPGLALEIYHDLNTKIVTEKLIAITPLSFSFQDGGFLSYIITPTYENLTESFFPQDIEIGAGKYNFTRQNITYTSDPSKKISFGLIGEFGKYYNGNLNTYDLKVNVAPIPQIAFSVNYISNNFKKVGELNEDKKVDLVLVETRLAVNPQLQLTGFYQRNTSTKDENYNIRLSWEYLPLSFVNIIFNKSGFQNNLRPTERSAESNMIMKVSLLKQL
jgi:hypothetical protein